MLIAHIQNFHSVWVLVVLAVALLSRTRLWRLSHCLLFMKAYSHLFHSEDLCISICIPYCSYLHIATRRTTSLMHYMYIWGWIGEIQWCSKFALPARCDAESSWAAQHSQHPNVDESFTFNIYAVDKQENIPLDHIQLEQCQCEEHFLNFLLPTV